MLAEEHRRIFASEWSCVGRTADLPNRGDYLTAEIPSADSTHPDGHRSIIVLRDDDEQLAAFDNVCVHRGSPLLHDCGNAARITCPYHAWVYRLDGQLIGAPYMNRTVDARRQTVRSRRSPPHSTATRGVGRLRLRHPGSRRRRICTPDWRGLDRRRRPVPHGRVRAGASSGRRVGHQLEAAVRELHGRLSRVQGAQEQLRQERRQHAC